MSKRPKDDSVKDPVCGMDVHFAEHRLFFQNIEFFFCSEQCRQRFSDNPHLYVGLPGHKAPKQEGREVLKQRRLQLAQALPDDGAAALKQWLLAMMGVKQVRFDQDRIEISYDLLQVTAEQIEEKIVQFGAQLGEGWAERLRRAWMHFEEENNIASLEVSRPWGHGEHDH